MQGETADEVAGLAKAMLQVAVPVQAGSDGARHAVERGLGFSCGWSRGLQLRHPVYSWRMRAPKLEPSSCSRQPGCDAARNVERHLIMPVVRRLRSAGHCGHRRRQHRQREHQHGRMRGGRGGGRPRREARQPLGVQPVRLGGRAGGEGMYLLWFQVQGSPEPGAGWLSSAGLKKAEGRLLCSSTLRTLLM